MLNIYQVVSSKKNIVNLKRMKIWRTPRVPLEVLAPQVGNHCHRLDDTSRRVEVQNNEKKGQMATMTNRCPDNVTTK